MKASERESATSAEPEGSVVPAPPAPQPSMPERIEALEAGRVATGESVTADSGLQDRITALENKVANVIGLLDEATARLLDLESVAPAVDVSIDDLI